MQVLYDQRAPLLGFDGRALTGSVGQRAQEVLVRAGIAFELREVPVPRQLLMVEQDFAPVCAVARLKTPERARTGLFSELLSESPAYLAVIRVDAVMPEPALLSNWTSHGALRWGVQAGLYYSDYVQTRMQQAQAQVVRFSANHQHFAELLAARRIDFFIVQADEAQEMLKRAGATMTLRLKGLADLGHGEQRYFYCSKSAMRAGLPAINQALQTK
jgi:hypothetical protein